MADDSSVIIESSEEEYEDVENVDDEKTKLSDASQDTLKWANEHSNIQIEKNKEQSQPELFIPSFNEAEIDFRTNFTVGVGPVTIEDLGNPKLTKWFHEAQDINIGFAKPENGDMICGIIWLKMFTCKEVENCMNDLKLLKDDIQVIRYNPGGPNFVKQNDESEDFDEKKNGLFPSRVNNSFKRIRLSRYPGRIVCIINIPSSISEAMIKEKIENALNIFIPKDYNTDQMKSYAYVELPTVAEANKLAGTCIKFNDDEKYSIEKPWPITIQELLKKMEKVRKNGNSSRGFSNVDQKYSIEKLLKHARLYEEADYLNEIDKKKLCSLSASLKKLLDNFRLKGNKDSRGKKMVYGKLSFDQLKSKMDTIIKRPQPLTGPMKNNHRVELDDVLGESIYFLDYKSYSEYQKEKLDMLQMQLEDLRERDDIRRGRKALKHLQHGLDIPMLMNHRSLYGRPGLLGPAPPPMLRDYGSSSKSQTMVNYNDSRGPWSDNKRNMQKMPSGKPNWNYRNNSQYWDELQNELMYLRGFQCSKNNDQERHMNSRIIFDNYPKNETDFNSGYNYSNRPLNLNTNTSSAGKIRTKKPKQKKTVSDSNSFNVYEKPGNMTNKSTSFTDYIRGYDYDELPNRRTLNYAELYKSLLFESISQERRMNYEKMDSLPMKWVPGNPNSNRGRGQRYGRGTNKRSPQKK